MELLVDTIEMTAVQAREKFFEDVYEKTFPAFARFAVKMKASFEDARDVFHDALVAYFEKCNDETFIVKTSPEAYIFGIARHLLLKRYHREHHVHLNMADDRFEVPDDFFPGKNESRLLAFLEKSGKKCMDLLHKFYFENSSLKKIAQSLGYRSEHSAAVQKFKCIGKLRDAIRKKSLHYEDLRF